ncbi:hypothetical protein B7494_g6900 [Chlorociboria aeruginascens]|nr:hypothetical protein B7494_g6900 [Chlorociboria aeruginascens]
MALNAQSHPAFPGRHYPNTLLHNRLPERNPPHGSSTQPAARESARREAAAAAGGALNAFNGLTDEQREEVNEAFALFDMDKDQKIDYHEFKVSLKALGFDLPKPEIANLLSAHGTAPPSQSNSPNQNASLTKLRLTLPAFQSIAANLISQRDPRDEILRAFGMFDTDGKGMISLDDLKKVARELGEGMEEDELVAMIQEFDLEGKGGVSREEFVAICMG